MAIVRRQLLIIVMVALLFGLSACRQESASMLPQTVPATVAATVATPQPATLLGPPLSTMLPADATAHEQAMRAEQAALRNSPRTPTQAPLPPLTQGEKAGIVGFIGTGAILAIVLAALVARSVLRGHS